MPASCRRKYSRSRSRQRSRSKDLIRTHGLLFSHKCRLTHLTQWNSARTRTPHPHPDPPSEEGNPRRHLVLASLRRIKREPFCVIVYNRKGQYHSFLWLDDQFPVISQNIRCIQRIIVIHAKWYHQLKLRPPSLPTTPASHGSGQR